MIMFPAFAFQAGWKTVAPTGDRFQVQMPVTPQVSDSSFEEGELKIKATTYMAVANKVVYQVVAMHPSQPLTQSALKVLYAGFDKNYLSNMPAKATGRGSGKLGIYPGRWVTFTTRNYPGIYWTIVSKGDLFVLSVISAAGNLATVKKPFLNSFKIR